MSTQPTPEDLEALLLAQHPASKHYLPAVKAKIVAAMQAAVSRWGTPATGGEPVAYRHLHEDGWEYYDAPTGEDCDGCEALYTSPQPVASQIAAPFPGMNTPWTEEQKRGLQAAMAGVFGWEAATSPQPVREPLSTIDLMRVVMKADEETQDTRGTTNWAAHIGKAVQAAVLSGGAQPVREPLTPERVKEIVCEAGYDCGDTPDPERAAFISGLRHGEVAHGITGGQHGTQT